MPKFLKSFLAVFSLAGALLMSNMANAADVEVVFSGRLAQNMGSLNNIEREREKNFRLYYEDNASSRLSSKRFLNASRFENVAWAGETLIPELENYTVENLIIALVKESLVRAGMEDMDGTIRLTIDRLKVANHSLNFLRSSDSYVIGSIEQLGPNGELIKSEKFSASLVFDVSVDANYQGPGFAFYSSDPADRLGPTLSRFIEKGLEKLFEGQDFSGPVIIG